MKDEAAFGPYTLERMKQAWTFGAAELASARRTQTEIRAAWVRTLREVDLLLTPTTPAVALPREDDRPAGVRDSEAARLLTTYTSPFNLTGLPAISIPCGFARAGLPIGLQLVAGPWREALLLRAARAYERATNWHERHPAVG
jgi:Asp-tRNA(Asn)/Glu-tRNA(Gln) amidotransferase A subunit family amidase